MMIIRKKEEDRGFIRPFFFNFKKIINNNK